MEPGALGLDELDCALLDAAGEGFPVVARPYEVLARRCRTSAAEAQVRMTRMRRKGIIRRVEAVLDSRQLGMVTTLVGADVAPAEVELVAGMLKSWPEATHICLREGWPNLWFVLGACSQERIDAVLDEVRGCRGVLFAAEFPVTRTFKRCARARVGGNDGLDERG